MNSKCSNQGRYSTRSRSNQFLNWLLIKKHFWWSQNIRFHIKIRLSERLWSMINKFHYFPAASQRRKQFPVRKCWILVSLCCNFVAFCSLTSKWRFRRRMKKFEYRKQTRGCRSGFLLIYLWVSGARRYFKNYANIFSVLHFVDGKKIKAVRFYFHE